MLRFPRPPKQEAPRVRIQVEPQIEEQPTRPEAQAGTQEALATSNFVVTLLVEIRLAIIGTIIAVGSGLTTIWSVWIARLGVEAEAPLMNDRIESVVFQITNQGYLAIYDVVPSCYVAWVKLLGGATISNINLRPAFRRRPESVMVRVSSPLAR